MSYDCPICGAGHPANCDCPKEAIAAVGKASDLEAELALVTEERDSLRLQVEAMRNVVEAAVKLFRIHRFEEKSDIWKADAALKRAIVGYEADAAAGSYACEAETCKWVSSPDSQPAMEGDATKCPRCGGAVTYVDRIG